MRRNLKNNGKLQKENSTTLITHHSSLITHHSSLITILVYDCGEKRVNKMLKLCRRYLNWIQNSVFEGEISDVKLKELKIKICKIMNEEGDSLIIFKNRDQKWLDKEILGKEKSSTDNFL